MNDHNLDDLIIGDPEPGTKNSKTLLTIIALLIVILIAGLILWALLFGSSDAPAASTPQTQEQPLDPSLIPLEPTNTPAPKPAAQPTRPAASTKPSTAKPVAAKPAASPQSVVKTKPKPKQTSTPQTTSTPAAAPQPTTTPTPKPAATATVATPKNGELIQNANKTIYYIQVGAYKRDPNPKFMQKLKDNGFTFITKTTKGIRRVRVGPYDSYDQAKAALPVIKEKLGVDGLIVKF